MRDVAKQVGITERAAMRIVANLAEAGILQRKRHGRRNHYEIDMNQPLRHPLASHRTVGALLKTLHVTGNGAYTASHQAQ